MHFLDIINFATQANLAFSLNPNAKNLEISSFCFDNRKASQGSLFVCLCGENNDGHNYAQSAIENGAVALIAQKEKLSEEILNSQIPLLLVDDTQKALEEIAHAKRLNFQGKVIAVTGTAGKTCLKEMIFHTLSKKFQVSKNYLNYNTQIGASISILEANDQADFWVLEAGISQEHDMDELGAIILPDIALVLNVGEGHAEGLPRGSAYYKSKLFKYLKDNQAKAFASKDYEDLKLECLSHCNNAIFFSIQDERCPYFAKYLGMQKNLSDMNEKELGLFEVRLPNKKEFTLSTHLPSPFYAENIIALCAILDSLHISIDEMKNALSDFSMPTQRFVVEHIQDITIIDDSYNANPLSFKRMLKAAKEYTSQNTRPLICIAGSMLELGEIAADEHFKLGAEFAKEDVKHIFYIGDFYDEIKDGYHSISKNVNFYRPESAADFISTIKELDLENAVYFIKGSRSNHLETYAQKLKNFYTQKNCE